MRRTNRKESGAIMLEGMIVIIITMLMLVWILGVGFLYYQKYTVRIVTNDVAKKLASTYDAPSSDIIMGYESQEDITKKRMELPANSTRVNQLRAESYVKYILDKANFYGTVQGVKVTVEPTKDAFSRSHIKVTTECTFKTPFGEGLEFMGMSSVITYSVTAYAESTSMKDHIAAITMADALTDGTLLAGTGLVEKTVKMINSFISTYKQTTG